MKDLLTKICRNCVKSWAIAVEIIWCFYVGLTYWQAADILELINFSASCLLENHYTGNLTSSSWITQCFIYLYYHHSGHKTSFPIMLISRERPTIKEKIYFLLNIWGVCIILATYSVTVSCCGIITTLSPQVISYLMSLIRISDITRPAESNLV